ncbi:hypothetical protein [Flavobacterium sp.]|uniref:hypothetical protein n=1 Tax=Flavobacterium sp. TaxID=239 RepID=UPI0039E6EAF8
MEPKTLQRIILFFSVVLPCSVAACGWSWEPETTRLALFRAQRNHFLKLQPFAYNANWYNEAAYTPDIDEKRNCAEWQQQLGKNIPIDDIYKVLYETDPDVFQSSYETQNMAKTFADNAFIKAISLPKNRAYFDYLVYAKKLEYNNTIYGKWESWDKIERNYWEEVPKKSADISGLNAKLLSAKNDFLRHRYAFLLLRHNFYSGGGGEVIALYRQYFANNNKSVLSIWAMYHMALCLENKAEANYYLSRAFVAGNDKSFACVQHFNDSLVQQTLAFAKNDFEKGVILAMKCMRNPAPALAELQQIQKLMPNSEYFSFLVQREINKLEDWIFSPAYIEEAPSVTFQNSNWYQPDFETAKTINYRTDIAYLNQLKAFLMQIQPRAAGEQKDYLSSAIAQLCFIGDDIANGKKYTAMISKNANASIQLQKNIQLCLVMLHQDDITDPQIQQRLFDCFDAMENTAEKDDSQFKSMYTLYRIASLQYRKINRCDLAGLFFLKSDEKKAMTAASDWYFPPYNYSYYTYIGYFERYASLKNMDALMALIAKKDKTPFERYICSGVVFKDINVYRDVKGTIAFRQNDLETAYAEFAKIPTDFWDEISEFSYLNEDPFLPKVLAFAHGPRKYNYPFNKARFVAELIKLKKQNTAESNMRLGHAYFNVSYYGSAWMMSAYGWTSGDYDYSDYVFGGNRMKREQAYHNGNYYDCTMAKAYYLKALALAKDKEQKALASLMLFECEYYASGTSNFNFDSAKAIFKPGRWIYDFNNLYANTQTYRRYTYNCPLLQNFLQ